MTEHSELVSEIPVVEKMTAQERLKHAKKRRTQQLKRYAQNEKERVKKERKGMRHHGHHHPKSTKRKRVAFKHNVVLLEAAARGDVSEVRTHLQSGITPDLTNDDGLTALHQCCIDDNEEMMKALIEFGANINARDSELWTPLHAAATCGHVHLAEYLLTKGADILAINSDGNMPYDICEDEVTLDYIENVMASRGITQEQIDELRSCTAQRMLKDLHTAVEKGSDVLECRDCNGATPLHIAAANGYIDVAEFLIDNQVNVSSRDNDGWQPIHAAACWAQPELIYLLALNGADLDARTYNDESPADICEDPDTRQKLTEMKKELINSRSNRINLVRRNSSRNRRSASVRRTSMREKKEISRRDAKAEAEFRNIPRESAPSPDIPQANIDEISIDIKNSDKAVEEPPRLLEEDEMDGQLKDKPSKNVTIALEPIVKPPTEQSNVAKPKEKKKSILKMKSSGKENKKSKKERKEAETNKLTKADMYYQDKYKQDAAHSTLLDLKRQRASKQPKFPKDQTFDSLGSSYQSVPSKTHKDSVDLLHDNVDQPQGKTSHRKQSPVVKRKGATDHKKDSKKQANEKPQASDTNGMSKQGTSSPTTPVSNDSYVSSPSTPIPVSSDYMYISEPGHRPFHRFKGEVEEIEDEHQATCCVVM
ncbi:protein phosphatase 1 regulatory subunit 16A-like [Glandiceps talaboti]